MASKRPKKRVEPKFDTPDGKQPARRKKAAGAKRRKSRGLLGRFLRGTFYWSLVASIWIGIAVTGIVIFYGAQMPAATTWAIPDRPPNVKIVAVDGRQLANRGLTGGEAIGLHSMSPYIPQAVIAIEDRRFYSHFGVDPIGLARAMFINLVNRRWLQGGSTLTQQLAKNLFLKPDRTLERKVQEVLLALWLEHKYSKDDILQLYLNRVYFGSGSYGVEAASRRYFKKSARDVGLSEAALLAGLLKAPSRLSPARDAKAAEERAQVVLGAMREEGMIGDQEMTTAMSRGTTRAASYWTGSENYVADRIMADLPELVGEISDDLIVDTTIDLNLQRLAEGSIRKLIADEGGEMGVRQGALVSIDGTGAVRAMVGGVDYAASQFDRATEGHRQPGSTFKPFVYLAALEAGLRPDSVRNDAPVRFGKWKPSNYGGKYYGRVTLSKALAKSLNSVAAQLAMEVGPKTVAETARRMGIESKMQANASIALGTSEVTPLELTAAYVPFANGGYRPPVHFIQRITTTGGKVLYENTHDGAPRVVQPRIVGMMNAMMQRTVDGGTARKAAFGYPAAGKTGTSQKFRDAWFIGYTANLTTGVWFGNDDGTPTKKVTGGSLPALAWKEFMTAAHEGVAVAALPGTHGLTTVARTPDARPTQRPKRALNPDRGQWGGASNGNDSDLRTGSTDRPVPPGDVGGPLKRDEGVSLLDLLLGR